MLQVFLPCSNDACAKSARRCTPKTTSSGGSQTCRKERYRYELFRSCVRVDMLTSTKERLIDQRKTAMAHDNIQLRPFAAKAFTYLHLSAALGDMRRQLPRVSVAAYMLNVCIFSTSFIILLFSNSFIILMYVQRTTRRLDPHQTSPRCARPIYKHLKGENVSRWEG